MRALTVRQPWADQFFTTPTKDIENRNWATGHRGQLVIHAAQTIDHGGLDFLDLDVRTIRDLGVVLGTVELTGCHVAGEPACVAHRCDSNPWAFWPVPDALGRRAHIVHWVVEHPRRFVTPIRARGQLTLWEPDPLLSYLIENAEVMV